MLDDIWLPGGTFKGLTAEQLAEHRGPMYALFETEFGVRMVRAEEKIRAVAADASRPRCCWRAAGRAAAVSVERLSYTYNDGPWSCGAGSTAPTRTTTATN
jgi:GntR family transcriptional regulator